jgi:hypothetical protein
MQYRMPSLDEFRQQQSTTAKKSKKTWKKR